MIYTQDLLFKSLTNTQATVYTPKQICEEMCNNSQQPVTNPLSPVAAVPYLPFSAWTVDKEILEQKRN